MCLLFVLFGGVANGEARDWAGWTGAEKRDQLLISVLGLLDKVGEGIESGRSEPCLVRLLGAGDQHTDLAGYSDLMVKSHLPRDSKLVDCIFATEREPWKAMTTWDEFAKIGDSFGPSRRDWTFKSGRLAVHVKTHLDAQQWEWQELRWVDGRFE